MGIEFLGQPFPGGEQIGGVVGSALEDDAHTGAWFVTAWGKQSGLSRMAPSLERLRARGGKVEAVLGVDEGGATVEGLKLALALLDSAWIFHDPGPRTFHPKMYVVEGEEKATAVVGSGNLTKGGLFTNYEAAVVARLDLARADDASFLADARRYFERLVDSEVCVKLTDALIDDLRADPRVLLLSERQANRARARRRGSAPGGGSVFGTKGLTELLGAPPPGVPPLTDESSDDDDLLVPPELPAGEDGEPGAGAPPAAAPEAGEPAAAEGGLNGFFKALSRNDVSLKDSPGQIIIPIAFLPFFGELEVQKDEAASGGPRQSHREFSLTYRDGGSDKTVATGRVILYEPAATHKRRNAEVRFTFRDRDILTSLSKDQVLLFTRSEEGIVVERLPAGWRPEGLAKPARYGLV
jgi:hypothetical protein